jgi:hypothetical protein
MWPRSVRRTILPGRQGADVPDDVAAKLRDVIADIRRRNQPTPDILQTDMLLSVGRELVEWHAHNVTATGLWRDARWGYWFWTVWIGPHGWWVVDADAKWVPNPVGWVYPTFNPGALEETRHA